MPDQTHIVCTCCHATNRIPSSRLSDQPLCGKCKNRLFTGEPVDLTQGTFSFHVNKNDLPVVVDFWAPWCGPCKAMAPAFKSAAKNLEPNVRLAKVNTEEEQALAAQFGIRSIPTLVVFKNGKEVARQAGAMAERDIVRWASQYK